MSNASSLALSMNNFQDKSPDQSSGLGLLFANPVVAAVSKLTYPLLPLGSWVSTSTDVEREKESVDFGKVTNRAHV
jgi:hypothetical protein